MGENEEERKKNKERRGENEQGRCEQVIVKRSEVREDVGRERGQEECEEGKANVRKR